MGQCGNGVSGGVVLGITGGARGRLVSYGVRGSGDW